jgi:putative ABC transport system permease protein
VDALLQDLRVALRRMRRAPVLAAAIVLTIGFGLGAAAAIVTTSKAALVEPLPYAQPARLVHLWELRGGTAEERSPTSYPTLLDWRSHAHDFSGLEGYDPANFTVGFGDDARMLRGAQLTEGFFRLIGVQISAGRDFDIREDVTTGSRAAIVSDRFARSIAGRKAVDQSITVNGTPYVIVGVLPNTFHFALLQNADIFVPLIVDGQRRTSRLQRSINVVGRLQDGVTLAAARTELSAVMSQLAQEHPAELGGRTVAAVPLRDALLGNMKPILTGLLVAVVLLLLTMGANLALLMLARYVERMPELAMRSALGATRARVVRQLLVESLAPSVLGVALAIAIGQVTTNALIAAIPEGVRIGMPYLTNARLDGSVVALIALIAIMLTIGFSLGPALLITERWARPGNARTTLARSDRRLRRGLVVTQLAFTVVLLISSGLLVVSFGKLVRRDVGFRDPDALVTARIPLSGPRYQTAVAQQQFYEALLARTGSLPGVRAAAVINEVPGGGGGVTTFDPVDRSRPPSMQPRTVLRIVGGEYFATMGIPVVAGRPFASPDRTDAPPVAVVSSGFARLLGTEHPVGERLRFAATGNVVWEVVGVVGDVQVAPLDADTPPVVYLSQLQTAENRMTLVLRTQTGLAPVSNQVRAIVKTLDPSVPVYGVSTLARQMGESNAVFSRRFPMILCGVFASAALALTLVALYAICMHDVVTRHREFGIRLAVGGSPGSIRRLILTDAILMGTVGIGIGAVVATLVSRSLKAVLFDVSATDWHVYTVVAACVLGFAFLATLLPALRAGSVDPGVAMRQE